MTNDITSISRQLLIISCNISDLLMKLIEKDITKSEIFKATNDLTLNMERVFKLYKDLKTGKIESLERLEKVVQNAQKSMDKTKELIKKIEETAPKGGITCVINERLNQTQPSLSAILERNLQNTVKMAKPLQGS